MDGLGRTIKVETGYDTTTVSIAETEYDSCACSPLGKVKRTSLPYAPGGTVYWTTYTYDCLGRTLSVTQPDEHGHDHVRLPGQHGDRDRPGREVEEVHLRRPGQPDPGDRARSRRRLQP